MRKKFTILLLFSFMSIVSFAANNNWIGGIGDWNVAVNWSLGTIPVAADDVTINTGDVTIVGPAVCKSVTMNNNGATVTVNSTLDINNAAFFGLRINGNTAVFINNGTINITNSSREGILAQVGTSFTNSGTININGTSGFYKGMENRISFTNTGTININNTTNGNALLNTNTGTFMNDGILNVHTTAAATYNGIDNAGVFNNTSNGDITLGAIGFQIGRSGIINQASGTFTNTDGVITVVHTSSLASFPGIDNKGTFINQGGGAIYTDSGVSKAFKNIGTFTNDTNSDIIMELTSDISFDNASGTVTNNGAMLFVGTSTLNKGCINNSASFINSSSGSIDIDDCMGIGVYNIGASSDFLNVGTLNIGTTGDISSNGIQNDKTFINQGVIQIGSTMASIGARGIYNNTLGTFDNDGGILSIDNVNTFAGIENIGIFNNKNGAILEIGANFVVEHRGVNNFGTFNNNTSGDILIDLIKYEGIYANTGSTFTNNSTLAIRGGGYSSIWAINGNGGTVTNNGTLNCIEDIVGGSYTNAGSLSPGESPGLLNVRNIYNSGAGAKYLAEIEGTTPDTEHDRLHFYNGGSANFDISSTDLEVVLLNSFVPAIGNTFDVMTSQWGVTGQFSNPTLPNLPADRMWELDYTTDVKRLTLKVVAVLPVVLNNFKVEHKEGKSLLSWETLSEINNKGFVIQRSLDSRSWSDVGFVKGNTNSNKLQSYQFMDKIPEKAVNFYRLKQVDLDGQMDYSDVRMLDFSIVSRDLDIFPNPVIDNLNIISSNDDQISFSIWNHTGILVKKGVVSNQSVDLSELQNGIYIIQIIGETIHTTKRITKQ